MTDGDESSSGDTNRDLQLAMIIADYIRGCESGDMPDRREVLNRYPEHAADLRQFFAQRDRMNELVEPIRTTADELFQVVGPGKQISYMGNYELLEEIARGGMGVIYKARQKTLGRVVAVKMIASGRLATEQDVQRFHIEAKAVASLQHPNIVAIHEVGLHEGWHYFSMDFVSGRDLASILRQNVLPANQAAAYVRQMAEAIHYAHQQGTLHRDLKPSNVLIDDHGQVRITDFGLAMQIERDCELTLTGQIMGTPSYMPPEQAQGKRSLIGPGSDVYALGAILYECLTGRAPFRADSVVKTIQQVIHTDAASPRMLNPGIPRDLETICLKCLEKEPHRRYGSAKLLADDLRRFLSGEAIAARPIGRGARLLRWIRRNPMLASLSCTAAGLLFAIAGVAIVAYLREASLNQQVQQAYGDVTELRALEGQLKIKIASSAQEVRENQQRAAIIEENYKGLKSDQSKLAAILETRQQKLYSTLLYLAQSDWEAGDVKRADTYLEDCPLHLRDRRWKRLKHLCHPQMRSFPGVSCLAISADGRWLASVRKRPVAQALIEFDPADATFPESPWTQPRPSPRTGPETEITFVNRTPGEIKLVWIDTTNQRHRYRSIAANESHRQHTYAGHVWLVTDTKDRLLEVFEAKEGGSEAIVAGVPIDPRPERPKKNFDTRVAHWEILVWDIKSEQLVRSIPIQTEIHSLVFHPDNRTLLSGGRDTLIRFWDVASGELRKSLAEHSGTVTHLMLSADGRRLASQSAVEALSWNLDAFTVEHKWSGAAILDPVGQRVAFGKSELRTQNGVTSNQFVVRIEPFVANENAAAEPTQIVGDYRSYFRPYRFSPQGSLIAIQSGNAIEIWNVAEQQRLFRFPVYGQSHIAFSHDGKRFAYSVHGSTRIRDHTADSVVVRNLHSGEIERLLPWYDSSITAVAFGPDGNSLATTDAQEVKVWDISPTANPTEEILGDIRKMKVGPYDWPQWGGSPSRVNTPAGERIPSVWKLGEVDPKARTRQGTHNVKWVANLGSQTYGNPVVANGKVFVGTNNGAGYLKRYPISIDLGVLLCFSEATGEFLWQHSNQKLPTGRVHDWPLQGVCSTPAVDGDRLWYVTNRGEVVCLDTEGFADGEDDGPTKDDRRTVFEVAPDNSADPQKTQTLVAELNEGHAGEPIRHSLAERGIVLVAEPAVETVVRSQEWRIHNDSPTNASEIRLRLAGNKLVCEALLSYTLHEADVVWRLNMIEELGVSPHNMSNCSPLIVGDWLFVCTSNGVDESHTNIPKPDAPSFIALDRWTGKLLWTDKSPGMNIIHAQWASPSYGVFEGQPQVIFPGGDGWVYSFDPRGDGQGNSKLLWKFDGNFKESKFILGGRATRNDIIAFPAIYDGLVYIVMGHDPEFGEGPGCLWCLDPAKRIDGVDVSESLAVNHKGDPIPHRRLQAVDPALGERAIPNPNSAVVWRYTAQDRDGNGVITFEEEFHRSMSVPVIKDDLLYVADFAGLFHCLNAKTGKAYWVYDMFAACWNSALIVDGKVFVGDEDGDMAIFRHSAEPTIAMKMGSPWFGELSMDDPIYMTPIVANNVLYVATKSKLFALHEQVEDPSPDDNPPDATKPSNNQVR